jgi:prepilin peptidase CpaA
MKSAQLISIAPLLVMLLWAAIGDLRERKIRNWLTCSMILTGLLRPLLLHPAPITFWQSSLGIFGGAAIPLALFAIGAVGGGDVKLLAGIGAWVGTLAAVQVYCVQAIIGLCIVLIQATAQGRLKTLSRNSAVLSLNLLHVGDVGVAHVTATGQSCRSVDKPLPFAVPVLGAVLILIAAGRLA